MRLHIKVYLDKESDQDCAGEKPDYFLSAPNIEMAEEQLGSLERMLEKRNTVSDEENPFKRWSEIDREASRTHSNLPPGYKEDEL